MPGLIVKVALLGVIIPLNTPIFRWAWRLCFGTMEEFEACLKYVTTWSVLSLFRFELHHDAYAGFKVALFLAICVGVVASEGVIIWFLVQVVIDYL